MQIEGARAFSELTRSCEELSKERRSRFAFVVPDTPNSANGGAVSQETASFLFHEEGCKSVEWWDGIGGQMVLARKRQAVAGKPRGTRTEKKTGGCGTAKLSAAAVKALEENSEEIAKSLLQRVLDGNINSAKLLLSLADGKEEEGCAGQGKKKRTRSRADALAAEPEWNDEVMEAAAETEFGVREPES
ncbi:MAG: hypothetical protein ACP5FH_09020 [Terracidiphilus sp.]